jgi:hypothetical protein
LERPPAFALSLQKPDDLFSDGLVVSDCGHDEGSQQKSLDTYIAMVKYRSTPLDILCPEKSELRCQIETQQTLTSGTEIKNLEPAIMKGT